MKAVYKKYKNKQEGSAMIITIFIITALLIIVATTVNMGGRQIDLATLKRNTTNTYYLAKSAAEKEVEVMNLIMQESLQQIVIDMNTSTNMDDNFIAQLVEIGNSSTSQYKDHIVYDTSEGKGVIKVKDSIIKEYIVSKVKDKILAKYGTSPKLVYTAKGDRPGERYETEVTIQLEEVTTLDPTIGKLKITSIGTTKQSSPVQIYDEQIVEAMVEISMPHTIISQIHEKYEFDIDGSGNRVIPEVLNNAITCYSDIIVGGSSEQRLNVNGDVYVGGFPNIGAYVIPGTTGVSYPQYDQNGGVIVQAKGELNVAGNVITTRNILATGGWGKGYNNSGKIKINEDVIAYSVGIVDDFYKNSENQNPFKDSKQVSGASVEINGNVMVDNDVMIDRWVKSSKISVPNGSIYGVNGGTDGSTKSEDIAYNIDPNKSSGVFCQGNQSSIEAKGMFVVGQPYIILEEGEIPLKLWESIGEPFSGVASFAGYAQTPRKEEDSNKDYLLSTSPFYHMIKDNKIKINFDKTYAIAQVSGIDTSTLEVGINKIGEDCQAVFGTNQSEAFKFFFQGGSSHEFGETSDDSYDYVTGVQTIIDDIYSGGCKSYHGELDGTTKFIGGTAPTYNYKGLRGYITARRGVLYNEFLGDSPMTSTFDEVINSNGNKLESIPANTWTYKTPIVVVDSTSTQIDISEFYVEEKGGWGSKPTIIINGTENELTIKTSDDSKNVFKGVIISKGPVKIKATFADEIEIEGNVIVGGRQYSLDNFVGENREEIFKNGINKAITIEGKVSITVNPDMIFDVVSNDKDLYRSILDMIGITHYAEYLGETSNQIFKITNMDNVNGKDHEFGKKIVNYTNQSIMELNTEEMEVVITGLKKVK